MRRRQPRASQPPADLIAGMAGDRQSLVGGVSGRSARVIRRRRAPMHRKRCAARRAIGSTSRIHDRRCVVAASNSGRIHCCRFAVVSARWSRRLVSGNARRRVELCLAVAGIEEVADGQLRRPNAASAAMVLRTCSPMRLPPSVGALAGRLRLADDERLRAGLHKRIKLLSAHEKLARIRDGIHPFQDRGEDLGGEIRVGDDSEAQAGHG